jgi:hypothetical protein
MGKARAEAVRERRKEVVSFILGCVVVATRAGEL